MHDPVPDNTRNSLKYFFIGLDILLMLVSLVLLILHCLSNDSDLDLMIIILESLTLVWALADLARITGWSDTFVKPESSDVKPSRLVIALQFLGVSIFAVWLGASVLDSLEFKTGIKGIITATSGARTNGYYLWLWLVKCLLFWLRLISLELREKERKEGQVSRWVVWGSLLACLVVTVVILYRLKEIGVDLDKQVYIFFSLGIAILLVSLVCTILNNNANTSWRYLGLLVMLLLIVWTALLPSVRRQLELQTKNIQSTSCQTKIKNYHNDLLKSLGCKSKYLLKEDGSLLKQCQNENDYALVWQENLITKPAVSVACLNKQCCQQLYMIYHPHLVRFILISIALVVLGVWSSLINMDLSVHRQSQEVSQLSKWAVGLAVLVLLGLGIGLGVWLSQTEDKPFSIPNKT